MIFWKRVKENFAQCFDGNLSLKLFHQYYWLSTKSSNRLNPGVLAACKVGMDQQYMLQVADWLGNTGIICLLKVLCKLWAQSKHFRLDSIQIRSYWICFKTLSAQVVTELSVKKIATTNYLDKEQSDMQHKNSIVEKYRINQSKNTVSDIFELVLSKLQQQITWIKYNF